MNELVKYDEEKKKIVMDSRVLAKELGIEHRSIKYLIRNHEERLGIVALQMPLSGVVGMPETFYLLDERQTLQIIVRSKNTEEALAAKDKIVDAFFEMREMIQSIRLGDIKAITSAIDKKIENVTSSLYEQIIFLYDRLKATEAVDKKLLDMGEKNLLKIETIVRDRRELAE